MLLLQQFMPLIVLVTTVVVFIMCGCLGSSEARKKGRTPFVWGIICLCCPPMLIILLLLDYGDGTPYGQQKCPHCAEWVKSEAKACRYCGRDVEAQELR